MTASNIDLDKTGLCQACSGFSIRNGKKYILVLIIVKVLIIWYIYNTSSDLWPLTPNTVVSVSKKASNITLYNVTLFHIPLTDQKDMTPYYIEISTNVWCFLNGINLKLSKSKKSCQCLPLWHGMDCGIPEAVWKSSYLLEGQKLNVEIRRRVMPRRIINIILFINEYDLFEIIVKDTFSIIDVFLIAEESSTYPTPLCDKLKSGYLLEFQSKIMPVSVKKIKEKVANFTQWSLLMFRNLFFEVWKHLTDFRPDDLFLFSHTSSVFSKDVLMFLKLYDGYPEPFYFELRTLVYQFQRQVVDNYLVSSKLSFTPLGCTFQYLHFICNNDFNKLFGDACLTDVKLKKKYEKNFWKLEKWVIGSQDIPSGWQCNWCGKVSEIETTLKTHPWLMKTFNLSSSFLNGNNTQILKKIITEGKWFDGSNITSTLVHRSDPFFAPETVKSEVQKYSSLIDEFI